MSHEAGPLAQIQRQIMWNRLIAVVEEQAQTMIRTAFSTTVREAGDLSAGIFDLSGRMMAQAVTGTPGHVNSMVESVGHFLAKFPAETMRPGDHYITNDPWLGTGHLHDLTVVTPAFRNGADRRAVRQHRARDRRRRPRHGPRGPLGVRGRNVYPDRQMLRRWADRTRRSSTSSAPASRLPVELEGDVYSLCACNDAGAKRLVEMMDEFAMDSLDPLADFIFESLAARHACRDRASAARHLASEICSDGYEEPITPRRRHDHPEADAIEVDFAGTSGLLARHQRPAGLLPRLCQLRHQVRGGAGGAEQLGLAWRRSGCDPGRLHPERPAALPGVGAPRDRPAAARPDDGLPAPGSAGPGHGRGRLVRCGTRRCAAARRSPARRRGNRPVIGGFRGDHLQLRRHRRAARRATGWTPPRSPRACGRCRWRRQRTSRRSFSGARSCGPIRAAPGARAAASARSWRSPPRATSNSR